MAFWKEIKGFENLYKVSNTGFIFSIRTNKILSLRLDSSGYPHVILYKSGKKYSKKVHRIVADTFLENPYNKPQVNHIDENKQNNNINNLEWVTAKENANHGSRTQRSTEKHKIKIVSLSESGLARIEKSGADMAERLGVDPSNIFHVLSGKQKTVRGFRIYPVTYSEKVGYV